ncbi:MAG: ribosomal RNA small subunit methyltransferase A [Parcubacteria group bacterium]|nr:ribosomal RNA small subunit methyltransferase A [Parcubacteria group bacterium]
MTTYFHNIKEIKQLLRAEGLSVNKRLGQNFLIDQSVVTKMIAAADVNQQDTILEVGPGLGALTEAIAEQACLPAGRADRVLAVEKDRQLATHLNKRFSRQENIEILSQDIFKLDFITAGLGDRNYKIVANLPFYITSHFLRFILEAEAKPTELILIVQKEVAKRVVAEPGDHSLLSLSVQFYGEPKIITVVDRRSFYPPPAVEAAILKIKVYPQPAIKVDDIENFFRLLKISFASRRKQLHNNLAAGYKISGQEAQKILVSANLDPTRRAETFSLNEWEKLYNSVVIHKK